MALVPTKGQIPKNAIVLSRSDAIEYQWNQINNWPRKIEVWPFRWGPAGLAVMASAAGMFINGRYRRKLKLRQYGFVTTSFPMIIAPAMFSSMFHVTMVTNDLFLSRAKCSLCLQYRAVIIQIGAAMVYPMVMAPIANFMFAIRHTTYRLPYWTDFRETLGLWWKFTKPMGQTLLIIACVQAIAASYLTYSEADKLYKLHATVGKLREEAEIEKVKAAANVTK